ncbi:hypothetical protein RIF29_22017 [Crotalaria pallida]|uniref:Large ribosomal subunit protein mL45 n=1 Tax=Crotalaria pallida TaxID=3830 RepID=A0AAN9F458_CROPI
MSSCNHTHVTIELEKLKNNIRVLAHTYNSNVLYHMTVFYVLLLLTFILIVRTRLKFSVTHFPSVEEAESLNPRKPKTSESKQVHSLSKTMMPLKRLQLELARTLYRTSQIGHESSSSSLLRCYSTALSNGSDYSFKSFYPHLYKGQNGFPLDSVKTLTLRSTMASDLSSFMNHKRMLSTPVQTPPAQARMRGTQLTMTSPGFIYEPYEPREKIPFWKRLFTKSGWKRTKADMMLEVKNAYAMAKLRKKGYSKHQVYNEAVNMYKEINTLIANGDKRSLRKAVTERMFSELKNEIKQRENALSKVYWELVEPVVKIRTLRARLIAVDKNDINKAFIQLTLEILAKQKFEAYDSKGTVIAGDKNKEVLVRDIWVFEKSLFHSGAYWRLCGRISPKPKPKAS